MSQTPEWYGRPECAREYLRDLFARFGIQVQLEQMADQRPQAIMKLTAPIGDDLFASAHLQGCTLRLTAHAVVSGRWTPQAAANYQLVNEAPWAGRLYESPDRTGTDLSLGLLLPPTPGEFPDVAAFLRVLFEAAMQLRSGQAPAYHGPPVPSVRRLHEHIGRFLAGRSLRHTTAHDGHVIVADARSRARIPVRLELFVVDDRVLVTRAHCPWDGGADDDGSPGTRIASVNQRAAAGAVVWDTDAGRLVAHTVAYPGLMDTGDRELDWLIDCSLGLIDAVSTSHA